ncbi:DUF4232 domain-containing protein [Streptomyces sp. FXJ1.4098]|uniref:DUF4232 domain-containing protein n=1 Tax=Streptomyces sp. NPDC020845 TaxID=3365096 RepID=UPI002999DCE6|nr:DUF4232 domain-containing protein [Streptomyces sp. FXJ1.4098]MDW6061185.1 DUF4232 domain-containing protein [Streptomyces sp. FXJ1.4098]
MSITTFTARRARTLRLAAVGLTAVAALTLTACNSNEGTGTKNEGKADSPSSAPADQTSGSGGSDATGGASDGKKSGGAQDAGSSKDGAKGSGASGGSDNSEQEIGPCDINKLTVGVKSVQRPVNYMVLEVNNHAGVDCNMPGYPVLKFGEDAQAATPVYEDSKPQAVVTLAPGETAYAGIRTSSADGSGQNGYKATSLEVFLEGSDDSKSVELPGGSVYIDDTAQVTYWQSDLSNALD